MRMNKLKSAMLLASLSALLIHSHSAFADFSGAYAPSNWTLSNSGGGDGYVDTSGVPNSITLYGSNNGWGGNTDYTTTVSQSTSGVNCGAGCTVAFDWTYSSTDIAGFDSAYYLVDGVSYFLDDTTGASGSVALTDVAEGTPFGFRVNSFDGIFGAGILGISGFLVTPNYTVLDAMGSLMAVNAGISSSISAMNLAVNGAHGRPLSRRVGQGKKTFWLAGDLAHDDHGSKDGNAAVAEIGFGYNFGPAQVNISGGKTWSDYKLINSGNIDADGKYLMLEGIVPVPGVAGMYATIGAYRHWSEIDARRGYLVNGSLETSEGNPDARSWGLRARVDLENAFAVNGVQFSPYADLWHNRTTVDSYTETGGLIPASYDKREEKVTDLRLGVNATAPIPGSTMNFVANVEAVHRANDNGTSVSGDVMGIGTFNMNGGAYDQNWLKGGVGVEGKAGDGKLTVMLNGTTEGEMPNAWIAASWQVEF